MTGDLNAHVDTCARCAGELRALEQLGRRAQELKAATIPGPSRERIVMALRAEAAQPRRRPTRIARTGVWLGAGAAGAVLGAGTLLASLYHRAPDAEITHAHASVRVIGSASYTRAMNAGDEVIRLEAGTVEIEAKPLASRGRLRVVTADAEVEVRGTRFDVTAADDRLQTVRVFHGTVEVRAGGTSVARLSEGDQWTAARTGAAASDGGLAPDRHQPHAATPTTERSAATAHPHRRTTALKHATTTAPAAGKTPELAAAAKRAAFEQGWQLLRSGELMEAATAFAALERDAPGDAIVEDAMFWRGVALSRAGQKLEARSVMSAFVSRFPGSPRAGEASTMLGWMLVEAGDRAGAVALFERAARDRSDRVRASARSGLQQIEALDVPPAPAPEPPRPIR